MKRYTMVVLTNPVAGREAEFNAWYTEKHLYDVIKVPGFISAQRFKGLREPGSKEAKFGYLAVYELETDDLDAALKDLEGRYGKPDMSASDSMDPNAYVMVCETITPVINRSDAASVA